MCFTCNAVPVLAPNYKQHILPWAELRKVCYSLPELYAKPGGGREVNETSEAGARAIRVWEPLLYCTKALVGHERADSLLFQCIISFLLEVLTVLYMKK
jgi:hypothetical protein